MRIYFLLYFLLFFLIGHSQVILNFNINKDSQKYKIDSLAELAYKTSVKYYRKNDYNNAIKYSLIEIEARKKLDDSIRYKKALFNQGLFLFKNKQYYKAIKFYKIVLDSFSVDKKTYITYSQLGKVYKEIGDYYQAENFYKKSLSQPNLLNFRELFGNYISTVILYDLIETKESLKKEITLLKKADSLSSFFKLSNNNFYALNYNFAKYYKNDLTFDLKKSKYYYQKVLKSALIKKDTSIIIKVYNNMGGLLNVVKNDSAFYYINEGIKLSENTSQSLPKFYYRLSEYNINKNKFLDALENIDKGIYLIIKSSTIKNLSFNDISNSNQKRLLFRFIEHKILVNLKLFEQSKELRYLEKILNNIHLADKLLDAIKKENLETQSKLFWQKEASEIYIQGVKTALLLNKPEDAFYFMEKNKALLLLENVSENQIRKQTQIPITVLEEELEIKQKVNQIENELNNNPISKDSLENEYYSAKIKLNEFVQSLKKEYPAYYKYKKPIEIIELNKLQKKLDNKTMVLEYIIDDTEGYVLAITKEGSTLHRLDSVKSIHKNINTYLDLISKPFTTIEEQNMYNIIATELYISLFPFNKNKLTKDISKLIIIPDNTLQNIPFETLKSSNKYLINNYEISYAYSLSFLEKNKTSTDSSQKDFLGFAPTNFNYGNLVSLKNSKKEIKNATNYFLGISLTDSLATKQSFLDNIENCSIIHLATHAVANDSISSPWIAFRNKKLFLNELYTLKTSADLVVLSACKTSLGKINKGEGVFSLARGFFYSGSKSVVSSLWNVNDKSSQEILSDFYKNLKEGKTKSQALRQAKLNYIKTHQLSEQSPYYWSSFLLIGDTTAIPINNFSEYYSYLFILFLIILGFFLYRKRIK